MRGQRPLRILGLGTAWLAAVVALLGLAFRALIWAGWEPYPGDPYGPSDIIDFVLGLVVVLLSTLSTLIGVGLLLWRPRRPGVLIAGLVTPVIYYLLHYLLPTHQLW